MIEKIENEIPDDVMEAARKAYRESPIRVIGDLEAGSLVLVIARAILAERERLSRIENWPEVIGKGKTAIIRGGEPCCSYTAVDLDDEEWRNLETAFSNYCRDIYYNKKPGI